jgi:hypothetical protein
VSLLFAPTTRPCKSGVSKWTLERQSPKVKQVQGDVNCYWGGVNFGKMFHMNSNPHAVTLNVFQGPSGNYKLTVRCPHD